MNAIEIIDRLKFGETVVIPASHAFVFMRECARHSVTSMTISMVVDSERCTMTDGGFKHERELVLAEPWQDRGR
jgi:hypothetical protein